MFGKAFRQHIILKIFKITFMVIGGLPKKRKLMIFESFHGKQYSDNPRAVYEYMVKHYSDYQLVWSVDRRSLHLFEALGIPYVRRFTLKWFLMMPRAEFWINNVRLPNWMPRPKKTKYLQTWHGTPLKKLGLDIEEVHMPETETEKYRENIISESSNWTYLVSPNNYSTSIFKRAFDFNGEVIESGYPRNDILYNIEPSQVEKIKVELGIPNNKKVILYAPTWRDDDFFEKGKYKFRFQFDIEEMRERLGDEYVVLTRMHYLVAESFDFTPYEGFIKDVSSHLDISGLYLVSDILITDYSSVFFDYANLNRPIIFYMYDLENYRDNLRGFYFDIEKNAPGPIVENEDELYNAIEYAGENGHISEEDFRAFYDEFCYLEDGKATERLVESMLE